MKHSCIIGISLGKCAVDRANTSEKKFLKKNNMGEHLECINEI